MDHPDTVYKILSAEDWAEAQRAGRFTGAAIDIQDGYIHFSAASQVRGTLAKWFAGRQGLVLLAVKAAALLEPLRWEPARGGELFPHLYGVMPVEAVVGTWAVEVEDAGGSFGLPPEVP